ncbi:MAG: hypothetical protein KC613_05035 [Myxococcales bacterium]|nr:hypothetical protein [Myxococcales bacterium]MCB9526248.1 hypothetical protein [Myxococcales bacterium]
MAAEVIGKVKTGRTRRSVGVKWNPSDRNVYVQIAGWTSCGKATSAGDAMRRAEAYVHDK